jgi:uncharacterized DUF497 family protein
VLLEFDKAKNARNIRERGISFERFADMDLETAVTVEDARTDYGERRVRLFGSVQVVVQKITLSSISRK